MGMFDTVYIQCPHCHNEVDCQTKSGDCGLSSYTIDNAPLGVMGGIVGSNYCYHCSKTFVVEMIVEPQYRVVKESEQDDAADSKRGRRND